MTDIQEPSQSEPLPIWYWLFMLPGAAVIALVAWGNHEHGGDKAWWLGTIALLVHVSLSGSVWRIADWLRLAAMPSMFLSTGFLDTLRLRVFWSVGPQFFGLLFLTVASVFVVVHWGSPPKADLASVVSASPATTAIPPVSPAALGASTPVSTPTQAFASEADTASPTVTASQRGAAQWRCDDPAALALVRQEVWAVAAMRIKRTHGVDLGVDELAPILEVGLQDIREAESDNPTDTLCNAAFHLYAHDEAKQLGLETEVDPDVVYWIERDASGNLQVGIGD